MSDRFEGKVHYTTDEEEGILPSFWGPWRAMFTEWAIESEDYSRQRAAEKAARLPRLVVMKRTPHLAERNIDGSFTIAFGDPKASTDHAHDLAHVRDANGNRIISPTHGADRRYIRSIGATGLRVNPDELHQTQKAGHHNEPGAHLVLPNGNEQSVSLYARYYFPIDAGSQMIKLPALAIANVYVNPSDDDNTAHLTFGSSIN